MTTKDSLQRQVIVPMNNDLARKFIKDLSMHVTNINCALKAIKSNMIADFICIEDKGIIIIINYISSSSDLQEIEKYVKNSLSSDAKQVLLPRLLQSKFYLKIVGILYINKKTNSCISLDNMKNILKNNHLFNNIILASKPQVIKLSPKSNMAIIWIDIWDTQSGSNTKKVINRWFNIRSFIATVRGANINPGISQCKNCWK